MSANMSAVTAKDACPRTSFLRFSPGLVPSSVGLTLQGLYTLHSLQAEFELHWNNLLTLSLSLAAGPYVRFPNTQHTKPPNPYNHNPTYYTFLAHIHTPSTNITPLLYFPQSQAIRANGQIFVSGQIPADSTGALVTGTIGELTQACCNNIQAILTAAGSDVSKIVKVNVFLTDMANFAEMNATYEKFFVHKPARSCVAVHQLPKGVLVEIECIALE